MMLVTVTPLNIYMCSATPILKLIKLCLFKDNEPSIWHKGTIVAVFFELIYKCDLESENGH